MNRQYRYFYYYFFLLRFFLVGSLGGDLSLYGTETMPADDSVWLTVFVHGLVNPAPFMSIKNSIRFVQDNVEGSSYEKSAARMRDNDFFYQAQAMGPLGLHYVDYKKEFEQFLSGDKKKIKSSHVIAYLFDQINGVAQTGQQNNRYYTFGHRGLLSPSARYQDGKKFFEALSNEIQKLKEQKMGTDFKVRVIGYSHGGNVALNLGAVRRKEFPDSLFKVDELVLVGVPIQPDTDYLIQDSVFRRVYNIYSFADRVQRIECFSTHRFFSGRIFKARDNVVLSDKLVQICLKVMGTKKRKGNRKKVCSCLSDISPGHAELWCFGWALNDYRTTYPLYPLPTISLLPYILQSASYGQQLADYDKKSGEHHLVIEIRPEHEHIMVSRKGKKKSTEHAVPFISYDKLNELKRVIALQAPECYTKEEQKKHVRIAL